MKDHARRLLGPSQSENDDSISLLNILYIFVYKRDAFLYRNAFLFTTATPFLLTNATQILTLLLLPTTPAACRICCSNVTLYYIFGLLKSLHFCVHFDFPKRKSCVAHWLNQETLGRTINRSTFVDGLPWQIWLNPRSP